MSAPGLARLFGRHLPALAILAAVAGLAVALRGRDELARWLAAAVTIACAPAAIAGGRGILARISGPPILRAAGRRVADALPSLVLAGLFVGLLGELALGHPPATRDHAIHYFHTQVAVDALREHGRVIGLSDRLGQGYAFGENYPFLPYLWTGAAHLLSFGLVSLRASYALGILAMWATMVAAIAWFARLVAGELLGPGGRRLAAWAGALAAGLWLVDPGASREGGWHYLMFHGVWPQLLATAAWTLSLPLTWRALQRPSPRRMALAALALGAALLAHPFSLMTTAASALAWLVVIIVVHVPKDMSNEPCPEGHDPKDRAPGALRGWAIIHVGAALLAAGWLVAFLGSADTLGRSPVPWRGLGEAATDLLAGELFTHHRAIVGPLALLGLVLALRRPRPLALLAALLLVGLLVLASDAAVTVLRLDLVIAAVKNLQFPRYAIALKPLLFAFAGIGGAVALDRALRREPRDAPPLRARLVVAALLAPLAIAVIDDAGRLVARPVAGLGTLERSRQRAVDRGLGEHLRAEAAREAEGGRALRVAFLRQGMGGGLFPIFAITDAGAGLVLDGHVPTINSIHRIQRRPPAALQALGVTHVVHDRPLGKEEVALAGALEPVASVGPYTLARLVGDPPRRIAGHVGWRGDAGEARLLAGDDPHLRRMDDPHLRRYEVRGLAGADLELVALPHRKWTATFEPAGGGEALALPLVTRPQLGGAFTGQRLRIPGDGVVTLRFVAPPAEARAGIASLVALGLALVALAFGRPLRGRVRLEGRARASAFGLAITALVVGLALIHRRQEAQLAETWRSGPGWSGERALGRDLADLAVASVRLSPRDPCDGLDGRDPHPGCSGARYAPRLSMLYRQPYLFRCVAVTIPPRGDAVLALALQAGERVRGIVAVDGDPARLRWEIAGVRPVEAIRGSKLGFDVIAPAERLELRLHSDDRSPREVCVAAAVVDGS